MSALVEQIVG